MPPPLPPRCLHQWPALEGLDPQQHEAVTAGLGPIRCVTRLPPEPSPKPYRETHTTFPSFAVRLTRIH
jgi:hypothetical protein